MAVQGTEGVGFRTEYLCQGTVTEVMLPLLFVLFISPERNFRGFAVHFFFSVLEFVRLNNDSIICSSMKLS